MTQKKSKRVVRKPQHQKQQPGIESVMKPQPKFVDEMYRASSKLLGKIAIITGGDSGIGRAVAVHYAMEGADVVITYLNEDNDAKQTQSMVEDLGRECLIIAGDISSPTFCSELVAACINRFKKLDIVVNNAAFQQPQADVDEITVEQLEKTFRINVFAQFYLVQAALPFLRKGAAIINTTSVTAYRGSAHLIDYSATKGAIVSFTRSLSANLLSRFIRVNAVAPGPIWTPLIPASFDASHVATFGSDTPMKRAGEPKEVAPCFVFLASNDASYITGQVLHPNGGEIING